MVRVARTAMSVHVVVELLGPVREAVGGPTVEVEMAEGAVVRDVVDALGARGGEALRPLLDRCRYAVGDRVVDLDEPVGAGSTLVVIPPVSGG
jgi:molybdopterin converting factor small subunit